MPSLSNEQRKICLKFGASCLLSDDRLKIGISETFDPAQFPIRELCVEHFGYTRRIERFSFCPPAAS